MATEQTIYAFAHVETWLEEYAKQRGLNPGELISDVVGLLAKPNGVHEISADNGVPNGVRRQRAASSYWGSMTAKQRSKEMRRRQLVRAGKAEPRKHKSQAKLPMGGVA